LIDLAQLFFATSMSRKIIMETWKI
jgi:hypothetical protein